MKGLKTFLFLVIPLLFLLGCEEEIVNENPYEESGSHAGVTDQLEAAVKQAVKDYGVAGAAVGIKFADDDQLWIGTEGKANLMFDVPLEWNDRFKIASITKTFTATAALLMVKDGAMDLDGKVKDYLPAELLQYVPSTATVSYDTVITVRQLLNHTCGIINFTVIPEFNRVQQASYANWVWQPVDFLMMTADSLVHEPGARWNYCNTGYIYLQLMIENVSGKSFGEVLETRIFQPLGLTATEYTTTVNPPDLANGYWDFDGNGELDPFNDVTNANPSMAYAAGSIVSNIPDMITWMEELAAGTLIGAELQTERTNGLPILSFETGEIGTLGDPPIPAAVGLGLYDEYGVMTGGVGGSGHYWGHAGSIDGYKAGLFKDQFGNIIAVCVNGTNPLHNLPDRCMHSTATEIRFLINEILTSYFGSAPASAPMIIPDSDLMRAYYKDLESY